MRDEAEQLIGFLKSKRWFGEKGRAIGDAALRNVIPVEWPGAKKSYATARAKVTTDAGESTYQLFFEPGSKTLTDALEDAEFRRGLADAFVTGATFESAGSRWIIQSEGKKPIVVPPNAQVKLATAEQTNSSVLFDGKAILKLYRKLEPGIHPDVEVTRFLTHDRLFVHVPVLLGTIRFEDPDGVTIAGMLQELVPGAVDGWTYALECSREYFNAAGSRERDVPFAAEAEQLGTVTRALHEALASGDPGSDFAMHRAEASDVRTWARSAVQMIEAASGALERAISEQRLPREMLDEARAITERRPRYVAWITELADGIDADAGAKTRTHGDYHLGQVLRSSARQFLVIDFEGEPLRPLSERRVRHSPLRDVSGMLRSFSYCAAVGSGLSASGTAHSSEPRAAVRAARWERAVRDAFLRGYFAESKDAALLPRSQNNTGRLISLCEAEKLFYELRYELDHRPDWVWIPLRGIANLYT